MDFAKNKISFMCVYLTSHVEYQASCIKRPHAFNVDQQHLMHLCA